MFTIGEIVHLWIGRGGGVVVPEEVTITKITNTQITARRSSGELLRFRARDGIQIGWLYGPQLKKLDRNKAEEQRSARALEDMRRQLLGGTDLGLEAMQQWSEDESVLRELAVLNSLLFWAVCPF